jgi:phenylacetate-coenzyme A ligase PaaK-like adenylate-forming protein/acyl-CoA reductase-like NAD-dependent aldehyde dehydrogenase
MTTHFERYRVASLVSSAEVQAELSLARKRQPSMLRGREVLAIFQAAKSAWLQEPQWRAQATACMEEFAHDGAQLHADLSQLDAITAMLDVESWNIKLGVELGLPRALDRVHESARSEAILAFRPLGLLLHICPGNSFMGGLSSVLHGVLTGNGNLAKLSRNTPAVIAVIRDLLESCGLPPGQINCLLWRSGDPLIEKALCTGVDGVAVWGGNQAIDHYKGMLPVGVRLLEFGPKLSFSLLTCAARNDSAGLSGLVSDVCQYEQTSCSSSQILLVQVKEAHGSEAAVQERERLLTSIGEAFAAYGAIHPPREKTKHEQMEILKALERAKLAKSRQQGDFLGGYPDWLLVWHDDDQPLKPSPLFRTWMIYPWRDEPDISLRLGAIRHYLQTASVCCAPNELAALSERLWQAGVNRIVAPGRACTASAGAPHDGGSILRGMCRATSMESPQRSASLWQSSDRDYVLQRLRERCETARQAPFYRRRLAQSGIHGELRSWDEFHRIPRLCKSDFYQYGPPLSNDLLTVPLAQLRDCTIFTTGGSTGEPKYAIYSREEFDEASDIFCRSMQELGVTSQDRVANLFVAGGLWSAFIAVNAAVEKLGCVNLPTGGNMDPVDLLRLLHKMQATVLYGVPTTILRLAHAAREHPELAWHLPMIIYGGEQMSEAMREYVSGIFGSRLIRSALYAAVDAGCIGYQCRHAVANVHHALESYAYVEICDEATGLPVAPGEIGEIVVTNLSRGVMPVLRMRTGDSGRQLRQACACGGSGMLFELLGRNDDLIRIAASNVHVSDVDKLCQRFAQVLSPVYQLLLDRVGMDERYELRIETKKVHDAQQLAILTKQVRSAYLELAEKLRTSIESGFLRHFHLTLLNPEALAGNHKTGKIKRVVDLR